jgi:hypothetical protein
MLSFWAGHVNFTIFSAIFFRRMVVRQLPLKDFVSVGRRTPLEVFHLGDARLAAVCGKI